jgi:PAS domain S-box-containing protein
MSRVGLRLLAGAFGIAVFLVDSLTPLEGAVAVLYVVVVLVAAKVSRTDLLIAAAASAALAALAYVGMHGLEHVGSPTLRLFVSFWAIGIGTFLALQNQRATERLLEQAQLLDLSHDMIFVRDGDGRIKFWNGGAEKSYGWNRGDAVGRIADELLATEYPTARQEIEAELLRTGRWEGMLRQRTRTGGAIVVESRWDLQRDGQGQPIRVLETHRDVTEREASHLALTHSERRYRRMFDASRVGLLQEDWSLVRTALKGAVASGETDLRAYLERNPDFVNRAKALVRIADVNPALLEIAGADSPASFAQSVDDILSESDQTFAGALLAFARGDRFVEGETEIRTVDSRNVPVIFGLTFPAPEDGSDHEVLAFVVDATERNHAQNRLLAAQAELAHAARVATLGELTASIAHEVNQPLAAIVTNGEAALRWLRRDVPDLGEVSTALTRAIDEGKRASAIVSRIRSFLVKGPLKRDPLQVAEVIQDAMLLVQRELAKSGVTVQMQLDPRLPDIVGDRVQIQQVLVNLAVNAAQAMASQIGPRLLLLRAAADGLERVAVTVEDTGPGIAEAEIGQLFEPFFTTKQQGMGMGLAICRSTIEAHCGRLSVQSRLGEGVRFTFTLPVST